MLVIDCLQLMTNEKCWPESKNDWKNNIEQLRLAIYRTFSQSLI